MSAPTPATGDGSPTPGYYPDPSIPGYVRYWNGAAWVPGTSRPAPKTGEAMPAAPGPAATAADAAPAAQPQPQAPASVEETGPVFFDEEPDDEPSRPEPATAWQADAARQTGFGGERDNRVAWGGGQDPRTSDRGGAPADPRLPASSSAPADPTGGALPGQRSLGPAAGGEPPADGTVAIRALRPGKGSPAAGSSGTADPTAAAPTGDPSVRRPQPQPPVDGTVAIRALRAGGGASAGQADGPLSVRSMTPGASGAAAPTAPAQPQSRSQPQAPAQRRPQPQAPVQPQPQPQPQVPAQAQAPVTNGPGGGSASWAQQVHRLAQPGPASAAEAEQPVVPWKPPVSDPFLQAAQAQAAARPASLGKRLAARLIDALLLGALVGAVAVPVVSQARAHVDDKIEAAKQSGETVTVWLVDSTTVGHLGIILGALLVLGVLYEALPTAKWGRTLGKKLCGLTVWDIESHEPPSFGAALRRWLVYSVLGVIALGVLNVLWCLFDRPWRQCWHDKAAHTFVTG
ncbi:RDD family protein [Streptomyces sp. V1I1]|uniref:RDD family protein n=1 Tax=Streptomyces sp. V1I1 TaxID=3042272 RepID=UPI00277F498C|nr:RDD family protein [Streptomyces sp. V1I1]MDQ0943112.1 putative RDD family membrane protein YckC [Streptomyces sp. V1I1]